VAEFTNVFVQQVAANGNAVFSETPVSGSNCIVHRDGSGIITLRGMTNQCRARYKVVFGGNVAIPTGGAVGPISIAISVEGEALGSATAIVTPAAVDEFFNVFAAAFIEVPRGCCVTVAIKNTSAETIELENANVIVERVC
jgi:molybdopterin-binding protein